MWALAAKFIAWLGNSWLGRLVANYVLGKVWDFVSRAVSYVFGVFQAWVERRRQAKELDRMKEAERKLKEANQIKDDEERLKRKAEAACELEKVLNPDSDCGA